MSEEIKSKIPGTNIDQVSPKEIVIRVSYATYEGDGFTASVQGGASFKVTGQATAWDAITQLLQLMSDIRISTATAGPQPFFPNEWIEMPDDARKLLKSQAKATAQFTNGR